MIEVHWFGSEQPRECQILEHWVSKRIWPDREPQYFNGVYMAVNDKDDLIAAMVYHNYEPDHGVIEISGAASDSRWLSRRTLHEMFSYPFEHVGCQLVVMRVSEHDKRLHRILTAYGFKSVRVPRLRGRDEAEIIYTLSDDDWVSNKFNKERKDGQAEAA